MLLVMGIVMNFFHGHGYLITSSVIVGTLFLVILISEFSPRYPKVISKSLNSFILVNVILILVMTISPVGPHVPTPEELYWLTQPKPPFFPNGWRWDSSWHDTASNVLLMLPLAVGLSLKLSPRKAFLCVMGLSGAIELFQHFYGHGRTSQLSDFLLNSLGGVLGILLVLLGIKLHQRFSLKV